MSAGAGVPRASRRRANDGPVSARHLALGLELGRRRRDAGMTLDDLASLSGVGRATIASAEQGRQDLSLSRLLRLADALAVDVTVLLREE